MLLLFFHAEPGHEGKRGKSSQGPGVEVDHGREKLVGRGGAIGAERVGFRKGYTVFLGRRQRLKKYVLFFRYLGVQL